ncbi:MAG: HAD hydrolase-like protein [Hyphomicrobiaceae bacterium]|nr:HAD hydrolase-like protein [Hyphomicrobiaceae bacterium]
MQGATIVFDLDGTLVDTAPDLVHATNHALARSGLAPVPAHALRGWVSFGARRMIIEALAHQSATLPEADVDALLDAFIAHYEANIAVASRPYDGLEGALDTLAGAGATFTVCTNKREGLSLKLLTELGLMPRFAGLAGRDTFPVCKPDPAHVLGAIRLAGGRPEAALMVGDSATDVASARAAGIPVVVTSFGYTEIAPADLGADGVFDHFDDLPAMAARLLAR